MQVSFDFTEQTEIVKREKRKPFEARQDWQRAPKIIVTEEYIALDKKTSEHKYCGSLVAAKKGEESLPFHTLGPLS